MRTNLKNLLLSEGVDIFSRALILGAFLVFISGCAANLPSLQRSRPLPTDEVCRVAVLPFLNDSNYSLANTITYKIFLAELNTLGNFMITQEGDINKLYRQLRIPYGVPPEQEQLQILTKSLNVQLLFIGTVLDMRENPALNIGVNPVFAMRIDILDGRTGDILWSIYNRRQGLDYQKAMHFGIINSITGLCKQVSREIINLIFQQGLKQCDETPIF